MDEPTIKLPETDGCDCGTDCYEDGYDDGYQAAIDDHAAAIGAELDWVDSVTYLHEVTKDGTGANHEVVQHAWSVLKAIAPPIAET